MSRLCIITLLILLLCRGKESESEVTQLCPTLCNPMDCSPPGSSMGFSRQEHWSGCHRLLRILLLYVCPVDPTVWERYSSAPLYGATSVGNQAFRDVGICFGTLCCSFAVGLQSHHHHSVLIIATNGFMFGRASGFSLSFFSKVVLTIHGCLYFNIHLRIILSTHTHTQYLLRFRLGFHWI